MDFWSALTDGFMPHGYCLRWDVPLLSVFIAGNIGIAVAYFIIPAALRHFVGKRTDLPYPHMFRLFAAFILSCGLTHLVKVWTIYTPAYWVEAAVDLWTALVSLATALLLLPLIPKALKLRSPVELETANKRLEEMTLELQAAKGSLEQQVLERTAALQAATKKAEEAERFYRQIFDLMPQMGWTARADGYFDFYNKGWYDYTGTTLEEMQGWGWEELHDPDMLPMVKAKWQESIKAGTPMELKFPIRGADGNFRWFLNRINPIYDDNHNLLRWVGINTDIQDEIDRAATLENLVQLRTAELQNAKELAERALESKGRLLATVSHEVRTPIAGIIGLAELLTLAELGEENNAAVKAIFSSSKRLLNILNDILDASKLGEGKIVIENRAFPVRSVIGEVAQLLKPEADKRKLKVTNQCDDRIPEYVSGDELRIRQILLNLGFNAIKFTEVGGINIAAEVKSSEADQLSVRFSVTDTGIGIDEDHQHRIFLPFEQAQLATARVYGGTGLGLSIAKNLTELMHGTIGVTSELGKGSLFWFEIPLQLAKQGGHE